MLDCNGVLFHAPEISRRSVLARAVLSASGCLSLNALRYPAVAATGLRGDLYAYPGRDLESVVAAMTWPVGRSTNSVSIHLHGKTWKLYSPYTKSNPIIWSEDGCRLFFGRMGSDDVFAVESSIRSLSRPGPLNVWAERFLEDCSRQRYGSPMLAEILRRNQALAQAYHSILPSDDRAVLTQLLLGEISTGLLAEGDARNEQAYGSQIAAALLPDVLRYDPRRPFGFSFAAQNGRHPTNAAEVVASAVMNLSRSCPLRSPLLRYSLRREFPYFQEA
jgi:hypothetical protein